MTNYKTQPGQQYYEDAMAEYRQFARPIWQRCAEPLNGNLGGSFDLLLEVAGNGTIRTAQVSPRTQLSVCAAAGLVGGKLPAPPSAAYWLRIPVFIPQPEPTKNAANR
jgi:hypothetical protein